MYQAFIETFVFRADLRRVYYWTLYAQLKPISGNTRRDQEEGAAMSRKYILGWLNGFNRHILRVGFSILILCANKLKTDKIPITPRNIGEFLDLLYDLVPIDYDGVDKKITK